MMRHRLVFLLGMASLAAGCTRAVEIVEPRPPIGEPISTFAVKFSTWFAPGTFIAALARLDVTSSFVPAAVAGGGARMRLAEGVGFRGGTWVPTTYPPPPFPIGGVEGIPFPPVVGAPLPPYPIGSGTGTPVPAIPLYTHRLQVFGRCIAVFCVPDEITFLPVHLVALPQTVRLRVGATREISVST